MKFTAFGKLMVLIIAMWFPSFMIWLVAKTYHPDTEFEVGARVAFSILEILVLAGIIISLASKKGDKEIIE